MIGQDKISLGESAHAPAVSLQCYRRIGFTGTQYGMSDAQRQTLRRVLPGMRYVGLKGEFHHGDCVGADAEAHDIAKGLGFETFAHPPENPFKRAFKAADHVLDPLPYLQRNRCIVDATEILIGTPKTRSEELRSGTWATIRFARKIGRPVVIVYGDGGVAFTPASGALLL